MPSRMFVAGGITDKLGTRKAFAIAICLWSVAAMLPGAAFSVVTFAIAMFLLGLGEAANFPACIKTVAEWFPKRERAYATGIFNSGANVGNMIAPIVVTAFVALFSKWSFFGLANAWRGTFVVAGSLGFVWLMFWLIYLSSARRAPSRLQGRTGTDPQRSRREGRDRSLEPRVAVQGSMGIRRRQVPHRSHLVVLSILDPRLPADDFPIEPVAEPRSGDAGVRDLNHRQRGRRLDLWSPYQSRHDCERGPQEHDVDFASSASHPSLPRRLFIICGWWWRCWVWLLPDTRDGRRPCSRCPPTCFPSPLWPASPASAAWRGGRRRAAAVQRGGDRPENA